MLQMVVFYCLGGSYPHPFSTRSGLLIRLLMLLGALKATPSKGFSGYKTRDLRSLDEGFTVNRSRKDEGFTVLDENKNILV